MSLKENAKKLFQKGKESLDNLVDKTVEKAKEIDASVQEKGGYMKVAKDGIDSAVDKAKEVNASVQDQGGYTKVAQDKFNKAIGKIEGLYKSAEDSLFTEGKYDSTKAKTLLDQGVDLSVKYGKKAGQTLVELSKDISGKAVTTYNNLIPNSDELKKYKEMGIGADYHNGILSGILLKPHYEKCITFSQEADTLIPKNVKYRDAVLNDIRASASGDCSELVAFYSESGKKVDTKKYDIIAKYLQ